MLSFLLLASLATPINDEFGSDYSGQYNSQFGSDYSSQSSDPIYTPPPRQLYEGTTCTYSNVYSPDGTMHMCRVCPAQTTCN